MNGLKNLQAHVWTGMTLLM